MGYLPSNSRHDIKTFDGKTKTDGTIIIYMKLMVFAWNTQASRYWRYVPSTYWKLSAQSIEVRTSEVKEVA